MIFILLFRYKKDEGEIKRWDQQLTIELIITRYWYVIIKRDDFKNKIMKLIKIVDNIEEEYYY